MTFKIDPIKRCALFLILFAGGALAFNFSNQVLLHLVATLGWGLLLYAFYSWTSSKHKNIWDTVITSLILFLVLHYGSGFTDLIFPLTATFIAITMKFFVEYKGFPVVNPVAAGVILSALVLAFIPGLEHPFASWWGASYQGYLSLALMAVWMIGGLYQWKKWHAVASFILVSVLGLFIQGEGLSSIAFSLTDATIYFYATIMLIEPKTSPFIPKEQIAYGALTALVLLALSYWGAPYAELFALVTANLAFFGHRIRSKK